MNQSKFNLLIANENNTLLINTLHQTMLKIADPKVKDKIKNMYNDNIFDFSAAEYSLLTKGGFLVDSHEDISYESQCLYITLFITNQCNFRCSYCYEDFNSRKLSLDDYEIILKFIENEVYKNHYTSVFINLFGGELLLEINNILLFLDKLQSFGSNHSIVIKCGLTTNGFLLTSHNYLSLVKRGLEITQITLDGLKNRHDQSRTLKNGNPTWQSIIDNLSEISQIENQTQIIIRTNFDANSINEVKDLLRFCHSHFNKNWIYHFEAIKEFNTQNTTYAGCYLNSAEEQKYKVELIKFCKKLNLITLMDNILSRGFYACQHCKSNGYCINTELEILACTTALELPENKIGYIDKTGKKIIYKDIASKWDVHESSCKTCNLRPLCEDKKCPLLYIKNPNYRCDRKKMIDDFAEILLVLFDSESSKYEKA